MPPASPTPGSPQSTGRARHLVPVLLSSWILLVVGAGLLPRRAAQITPVALFLAGLAIYQALTRPAIARIAKRGVNTLGRIPGADALSLLVASVIFGHEVSGNLSLPGWGFLGFTTAALIGGFSLVLQQGRLSRQMLEDSKESEEQQERYEKFTANPAFRTITDTSAVIAVYLMGIALATALPADWPGFLPVILLVLGMVFIGLWNRCAAGLGTGEGAAHRTGSTGAGAAPLAGPPGASTPVAVPEGVTG